MTLYYIRHGETDGNLAGLLQGGEHDLPLNATGFAQSQSLAERQKSLLQQVDHIVVSPMLRTRQTAETIFPDRIAEFKLVESFREWVLGDYSMKPYLENTHIFEWPHDPPNGEPSAVFQQRVADGLASLGGLSGTVCVVAHGVVWRAVCAHLGLPFVRMHNASLHHIHRENGEHHLVTHAAAL